MKTSGDWVPFLSHPVCAWPHLFWLRYQSQSIDMPFADWIEFIRLAHTSDEREAERARVVVCDGA